MTHHKNTWKIGGENFTRERERESSTVTRCVHKARERKGFDRQEVNCPKFKSIQSSTIALDGSTVGTLNDLRSIQFSTVCVFVPLSKYFA